MLASLFAGVAGLRNHQTRMNVIGNNISNINTIGFKSARSVFQEALIQTLKSAARPSSISGGTNPVQMGLGMNVASIDNIFTQGGLEITGQITDLAIQGNGFFILSDGSQNFYTRAGAFGFDANSYLVSPSSGLYVQGKMADEAGTIPTTATAGNIKLPFGQQDPARATTEVQFGNNLDADATRADASTTTATTATNGVVSVTGTARNGAGGLHLIEVTGAQATSAWGTGTNLTAAPLTNDMLLGDPAGLNVGVFDLSISVDGDTPIPITGLTASSTVSDLLAGLNSLDGVNAELVGGEIRLTRAKAGAGYSITTSGATAGSIATQASRSGSSGLSLTGAETLGALGVTDFNFTVNVDGGGAVALGPFNAGTTVNQFVSALTAVANVTATIDTGEILVTHDVAGASSTIVTNAAAANNIVDILFGMGVGTPFLVNNGTDATGDDIVAQVFGQVIGTSFTTDDHTTGIDHTFNATDTFTPSVGGDPVITSLGIHVSDITGLADGLTNLGGGGVTISAGDAGLNAGQVSVTTEDTEKATSITVYDTLGGTHTMMTNFIKSHEPNKWYWEISLGGGEEVESGYTGYVKFNSSGSLLDFHIDGGADHFVFDPNNGAGLTQIELDPGTIGLYDGLTGFSGTETVTAMTQDGYGMGILEQISIDPTGLIIGKFTNGVSRNLAQITLADFNNEGGLTKAGNSLFSTSANSGAAIEGVAGETVSATISSGALESANVDLAQEFTAMIIAQRGFQSNARVITTSDNMLDELVNLKR
jgi:flagellar hook protein FlgE